MNVFISFPNLQGEDWDKASPATRQLALNRTVLHILSGVFSTVEEACASKVMWAVIESDEPLVQFNGYEITIDLIIARAAMMNTIIYRP